MTSAAELPSPDEEAKKQEADRPPPQKPQNRQNDWHGASSCVNVMNIYFTAGVVVKSILGLSAEIWARKPAVSRPRRVGPEPSQIDQHLGLQEFPRGHRQRALRAIGASK